MLVHAIVFLGAIALAVAGAARLPGIGDREDPDGSLDRADRLALALPFLLGVFTLVQAPGLLLHSPASLARALSLGGAAVLVVLALWPLRRRGGPAGGTEDRSPVFGGSAPSLGWWWTPPAVVLAAALAAVCFVRDVVDRRLVALLALLSVAAGAWLLVRAPSRSVAVSSRTCATGDRRERARFAFGGTGLLIALGTIAVVLGFAYTRDDLDDVLYLSAALELPHSDSMGRFEPDHHGEELPANPLYALQAFELFGAQLCQLSGVSIPTGFRTLLAPVLWIASLLVHRRLLRRWLPPGAVNAGLSLLLAYFLLGASSHWTACNYFFPRPQQGKTWLLHLYLPALWVLFAESRGRGTRTGVRALLLGAGACGTTPTAVFLVPAFVFTLSLAEWWRTARLRPALLRGLAAVLPCAGLGAYVVTHEDPLLRQVSVVWSTEGSWFDALFFHELGVRYGGGAVEIALLTLLPLGAIVALRSPRGSPARSGPFAVAALVLLTVANPLGHGMVAEFVTGSTGYSRLFWLLPFGSMLAVLGAGMAHRLLPEHDRSAHGAGLRALLLLALCVGAIPALGGRPWCSPDNVYPFGKSVPRPPFRTTNLDRIPPGLFELIGTLDQRAESAEGGRLHVLCNENLAAHLAPSSERLSFVFTREYQTPYALRAAGRSDLEGEDRRSLGEDFLTDRMTEAEAAPIFERCAVQVVVTENANDSLSGKLRALGFAAQSFGHGFSLWTEGRGASSSLDPQNGHSVRPR